MDAAAESSILPILGSVGSMGKKATIKSLRSPILKELHGITPLRSDPIDFALWSDCFMDPQGPSPVLHTVQMHTNVEHTRGKRVKGGVPCLICNVAVTWKIAS